MALRNKEMGKRYNGKPTWPFTLQTAARARRWALRMRLGWKPTRGARQAGGEPFPTAPEGDADNTARAMTPVLAPMPTAMASRWPKATKDPL